MDSMQQQQLESYVDYSRLVDIDLVCIACMLASCISLASLALQREALQLERDEREFRRQSSID